MRKPLPYGIDSLPGTRRIEHPGLVHVQFQRRRARQLIKLTEGATVKISMASLAQQQQPWNGLMLTGSRG